MALYTLYSVVFTFLIVATILYFTRDYWRDQLTATLYKRIPSTFAADAEDGLTSDDFDLGTNIEGGDSRQGLDAAGKREVKKIMKRQKLGFDEARRIYTQSQFARNNVGPDGVPRDPKFVSFSP